MDNTKLYTLGAFVGWLLVQVSGTAAVTLDKIISIGPIHFLPNFIGTVIATIGWVATLIFSFQVIKSAWLTLRRNK